MSSASRENSAACPRSAFPPLVFSYSPSPGEQILSFGIAELIISCHERKNVPIRVNVKPFVNALLHDRLQIAHTTVCSIKLPHQHALVRIKNVKNLK
jgi:hypothetical protein